MIKSEFSKKNVNIITDIICDSCGNSCKVHEYIITNPEHPDYGEKSYDFEYVEIVGHWGYFSKNKDLQKWSAHICEKCVDEKMSFIKFKIEELHI